LIGQQVEFVIGDVNSPGSLFGLLADAVATLFECAVRITAISSAMRRPEALRAYNPPTLALNVLKVSMSL
jgi:hypothetical protein